MKIAILGKGGSGKSSISWLIANVLTKDMNFKTLAIDGDHNMDLTSNLGVNTDDVNFFKGFNTRFRELSGMPTKGMWKEYFSSTKLDFIYPNDPELNEYIKTVSENLELMVIGLGDQDLMNYQVCSHGVSAPLKYLLPTIALSPKSAIVYDSVAGVDMLNYGMYFGFDLLLVVVESHTNSIKVAKQIQSLAKLQGLEVKFLLNKYNPESEQIREFENENSTDILARISKDEGIESYNYSNVTTSTVNQITNLIESASIKPIDNIYDTLRSFELNKK